MKVYILTAVDTLCNLGLEIFGVFPSRERAEVAMEYEIDAYGGPEECDFEFEIKEYEVKDGD